LSNHLLQSYIIRFVYKNIIYIVQSSHRPHTHICTRALYYFVLSLSIFPICLCSPLSAPFFFQIQLYIIYCSGLFVLSHDALSFVSLTISFLSSCRSVGFSLPFSRNIFLCLVDVANFFFDKPKTLALIIAASTSKNCFHHLWFADKVSRFW